MESQFVPYSVSVDMHSNKRSLGVQPDICQPMRLEAFRVSVWIVMEA